jgi:hypothetical protein
MKIQAHLKSLRIIMTSHAHIPDAELETDLVDGVRDVLLCRALMERGDTELEGSPLLDRISANLALVDLIEGELERRRTDSRILVFGAAGIRSLRRRVEGITRPKRKSKIGMT